MRQPKVGGLSRDKLLFNRGLLWFSWLIILLIVAELAFCPACSQSSSSNSLLEQPQAAVIDQLYSTQPNADFINQVRQDLKDYGFIVHVYQGNDVTVALYRKLPKYGYKLIIVRAHSGLIESGEKKIRKTAIFTNEPYSRTKYLSEQANRMLPMVRVREGEPFFFGIDSKFVVEGMKGRFDDAVIVVAGCSCLYLDDMAQAFIHKGASAYLAWDRTVNADYVDEATTYLVRELCKDSSVEEAVKNTMIEKGRDPTYSATLTYFPRQSGDKILKQLIG